MPERPETQDKRPFPRRPELGFTAWQMTLGYISQHYSPDAILKLQAYPANDAIQWSVSVSWAHEQEIVRDRESVGVALTDMWLEIERNHRIFASKEEAIKQPAGYAEAEWFDVPTYEILQRIVWTTQNVFAHDWLLIVVYQPVESPGTRVQMRLLANNNQMRVGSRGASVLEAGRDLFRNAAPMYAAHAAHSEDET
jgi:hypothetical protein